jgi:hypothetical protein
MNRKLNRATVSMIAAVIAAGPVSALAQTSNTTGNLQDLVSDLYGGNGITLDPTIVFHTAHFSSSSQAALNNLSNVISASIGPASFNSTVSAISFDIEEGVPVRSQESLGPLIAERASTIGKGQLNIGVSYTNVNYKRLNGTRLSQLQLVLDHDVNFNVPFEQDDIVLNLDLRLKQQIFAFIGTYGVTNNLDIGLIVPLMKIDGRVRSTAMIVDNGGLGIHQFGGTFNPVSVNQQSATGVGDMILRAKYVFTKGTDKVIDFGALLQASLGTGDEKDLLGAGSSSIYLGGIVSANLGKINPHINFGYEYFVDQKQSVVGLDTDRSSAKVVAGFDLRARDNFAISPEFIGRWQKNGQHLYDLALGAKWAPLGNVPISANIVMPLNRNEGLRPNYYFTIGIESTF